MCQFLINFIEDVLAPQQKRIGTWQQHVNMLWKKLQIKGEQEDFYLCGHIHRPHWHSGELLFFSHSYPQRHLSGGKTIDQSKQSPCDRQQGVFTSSRGPQQSDKRQDPPPPPPPPPEAWRSKTNCGDKRKQTMCCLEWEMWWQVLTADSKWCLQLPRRP